MAFDNLDDPKTQALIAMGLGLLGGSGSTRKNFGADLSHAGLLGMGAYTNQRVLQAKLAEEDQQKQMRAMQIAGMQHQGQQQQQIDALAPKFMSSGQPLTPNDDSGNPMPSAPPNMDYHGYANALTAINPQQGLAMQQQLAAMQAKERVKVDPGQTIGTYQGNKFVPDFAAPDKPPAGFIRGADGKLTVDPQWLAAQKDIRAAGKPQVTVDNRQENAFSAKVGQEFADNYMKLQTSGATAAGKMNKLDRLSGLLDQAGKTGKYTPTTMEFKAAADSLGFKIDPKLPYQQAADALSKELALEMRNPSGGAGMPGALSDSDRQYLSSMVPNLAKTAEGNKQLIDTAKKIAQRDKEIAALARDYKNKNGKFDEGFYAALSDYSEKNPLFPKPQEAKSSLSPAEQQELAALRKRFGSGR